MRASLLAAGLGFACALFASDSLPVRVQETNVQRMDFPAGGTLHIKNSRGELAIEGWDRQEVEVTVVKSVFTADLPKGATDASALFKLCQVTLQRNGSETVVATAPLLGRHVPLTRRSDAARVSLDYRINVPRDAKLAIEHDNGEVHVAGMDGDVRATVAKGEVTLMLAPDAQYDVRASSHLGDVISDFAGQSRRRTWVFAHRFTGSASAASAHKLDLRIGSGNIIILKTAVQRAHADSGMNAGLPGR